MTTVTMTLPCFVLFSMRFACISCILRNEHSFMSHLHQCKRVQMSFSIRNVVTQQWWIGPMFCFKFNWQSFFWGTKILLCYTVPFGLRLFYTTPEMSEWLIRINFSHSILIHSRDLFWLNKLLKTITQVYACTIGDIFQFCFNFPWTWAKFASCFAIFD